EREAFELAQATKKELLPLHVLRVAREKLRKTVRDQPVQLHAGMEPQILPQVIGRHRPARKHVDQPVGLARIIDSIALEKQAQLLFLLVEIDFGRLRLTGETRDLLRRITLHYLAKRLAVHAERRAQAFAIPRRNANLDQALEYMRQEGVVRIQRRGVALRVLERRQRGHRHPTS